MAEPNLQQKPTRPAPKLTVLRKKHPLAIRWFHWINFPVLAVMVWSGLLIYWAYPAYDLTIFGAKLFHFFPGVNEEATPSTGINWFMPIFGHGKDPLYDLTGRLAEGMAWHFLFMYFFTLNGILYVTFLIFSGEWRYLVPNRKSFGQAIRVVLHDLHLSKKPLPPQKFNGAQKFAYTGIIVMGLGSVLTGLAIFRPIQVPWLTALMGGYEFARILHFALMIGFCLFFLVHVAQVVKAGWNNFRAMITGFELARPGEEMEI